MHSPTLGSDSESDNDVCAMERARDMLWASGVDPELIFTGLAFDGDACGPPQDQQVDTPLSEPQQPKVQQVDTPLSEPKQTQDQQADTPHSKPQQVDTPLFEPEQPKVQRDDTPLSEPEQTQDQQTQDQQVDTPQPSHTVWQLSDSEEEVPVASDPHVHLLGTGKDANLQVTPPRCVEDVEQVDELPAEGPAKRQCTPMTRSAMYRALAESPAALVQPLSRATLLQSATVGDQRNASVTPGLPTLKQRRFYSPWIEPLREALKAADVDFQKELTTPCYHHALCAGGGTEYISKEAYDLPIHLDGAADSNPKCRQFLLATWLSLGHVYEENNAFLEVAAGEKPFCCRCRGPCTSEKKKIGIASGGFPCKPFSAMRDKKGKSASTGPTDQHPQFKVVMVELPAYVREWSPASFWVEEVVGLLRVDPKTGATYLSVVVQSLTELGYCIRVLKLEHFIWMPLPRLRLFILGFSEEGGGQKAADWVVAKIMAVTNSREAAIEGSDVYNDVWAVLHHNDTEEIFALDQRKATIKTTLLT